MHLNEKCGDECYVVAIKINCYFGLIDAINGPNSFQLSNIGPGYSPQMPTTYKIKQDNESRYSSITNLFQTMS